MKRLVDVVLSSSVLLLALPLVIVIAILIRWRLGSPVFFRQQRPGLHGKPFCLIKFRTMRTVSNADDEIPGSTERLTDLGRFLRSTSLDELPELWNVLRGDMSLVGPRPLLQEYLPLYSAEQSRRHAVLPGITGWAQINGRNQISWKKRLEMDVWYVDHLSLALDIKILIATIGAVLRREGISQDNHVTMEPFKGDQS